MLKSTPNLTTFRIITLVLTSFGFTPRAQAHAPDNFALSIQGTMLRSALTTGNLENLRLIKPESKMPPGATAYFHEHILKILTLQDIDPKLAERALILQPMASLKTSEVFYLLSVPYIESELRRIGFIHLWLSRVGQLNKFGLMLHPESDFADDQGEVFYLGSGLILELKGEKLVLRAPTPADTLEGASLTEKMRLQAVRLSADSQTHSLQSILAEAVRIKYARWSELLNFKDTDCSGYLQ